MSRPPHPRPLIPATLVGLLPLLGLLPLVAACGRATARPAGTATIVETVDGDTVVVRVAGVEETVRLLGIDTPETKHPTKPVECWGAEASARTAGLLPPGTEVRLERDTEARDAFGRLLAYVHRADDGLFVNLALVEGGDADVLIIEPNHAYAPALRAAAGAARSARRGLWGACGGADTPLDRARDGRAGDTVWPVTTLAERLGYGPDERLLIINCDDLGSSHAANQGVYESLRSGLATSATLMVPCPWAREAAAHYRGEDVGVHLTLNAEYDLYRWGPITTSPSLLDGDGGFPRTVQDVWDHADLDEVRRECAAQIERAILWGFDVSHLDSHMGTLQLRPEFFDVYLDLAVDYGLPLRLSGASTERSIGFPFRSLAADEGVLFPDHFIYVGGVGSRRTIERAVFDLQPGVTEIYVHPAADTPELRAFAPDWANRVDDHHLMCHDSELRTLLERAGIRRIGWRDLRDLQRA